MMSHGPRHAAAKSVQHRGPGAFLFLYVDNGDNKGISSPVRVDKIEYCTLDKEGNDIWKASQHFDLTMDDVVNIDNYSVASDRHF